MSETDILIFGTGAFGARILFDLATVATEPTNIVIAGRNVERLAWLTTAAKARSKIFGAPVRVTPKQVDLQSAENTATVLGECAPRLIVQAASPQASNVIAAGGNAWTQLIAQTGYSLTAVFQAYLSARVAAMVKDIVPNSLFVNCCYPDVSNSILKAANLPITSGVGNVAILAAVFAASKAGETDEPMKVLAHYQTLTPWRLPADERKGPAPRVWIGQQEVDDVFALFRDTKLTREPVIDVSGATNVPMMLAMAHGRTWRGHAPGPNGLPGGYPLKFEDGKLSIDPPPEMSIEQTIEWNAAFERHDGAYVETGRVRYAGKVYEGLAKFSPELAKGFGVEDLEMAHKEMADLRGRLEAAPVA